MEEELTAWSSQMAVFHIPRWAELPDMDLYKDQIISQLDKYLAPIQSGDDLHFVTASMINNYVKQQLLPAPIKKRYGRVHMAHLVVICLLKQVLSIPAVKLLLTGLLTSRPAAEMPAAYDAFCAAQEHAFGNVAQMAAQRDNAAQTRTDLAMDAAVLACAGKTLAQKLIPTAQQPGNPANE